MTNINIIYYTVCDVRGSIHQKMKLHVNFVGSKIKLLYKLSELRFFYFFVKNAHNVRPKFV